MLEIIDLSKSFKNQVLQRASLCVDQNNLVFLTGPNGSGKSTLLRMIIGLVLPDKGQILLDGKPTKNQSGRISLCSANGTGFYRRLTPLQNLYYFGSLYRLTRKEVDAAIARQAIFDINYWNTPVEQLSTGMLQKINIIRAFLHEPALILLDEALNSLDTDANARFLKWLDHWLINSKQKICIFVQHSKPKTESLANVSQKQWCIDNFSLREVC